MEKAGFTYQSAVNGLEAVQKVEGETFHAIIMGKLRLRLLTPFRLTSKISLCRSWMA
jgi:hypothetical protein